MVGPMDSAPVAPSASALALTPGAVREAFQAFQADSRHRLMELSPGLGEQQRRALVAQIDTAGRAFLDRIGVGATVD